MAARLAGLLLIGAACGLLPHAASARPADPLEGLIVREIRVTGLRNLSPDTVIRHLATRTGEPFRRRTLALDQRRLDELRLFSAVEIRPELDAGAVVLQVAVTRRCACCRS
jgi:outer membrane protein assembly factor BamA